METSAYYLCCCCIAAVFRRKARVRGTRNPPSPPLTVAPEICAHSNQQKIQWGCTHMLITNLYAFLCCCWTLLSLFKPRKLNHLDTFTTDGTGWTTEKPWMCCSLHALIWDYGLHRALIILSQLPVHQNSQYWLLTLADWCTPTALRWALVALHLPPLMNRFAQWLQPQRRCPHTMYGEIPSSTIFFGFSAFFSSNQAPFRQDVSGTMCAFAASKQKP